MKKFSFELEEKTIDLILKFERVSFLISLIGIIGLYIFWKFYIDLIIYNISISIFKVGLLSGICSFCFGTFFNGIKKGIINR